MTFSVFHKYKTPLSIAALVFTVAVFVFFPSFGSASDAFTGDGNSDEVYGSFRLQGGGETVEVSGRAFGRTYQNLARLYLRYNDLEDSEVWSHIMLVADARDAGLQVPDADLVRFFQDNGFVAAVDYERFWRDRKFASAKSFEEFIKEVLLVQQWTDVLSLQSGIVSADDVYLSWRIDHEVFDMEAMVFTDFESESIADPGDEVLEPYFDETPEYLRARLYSDPARYELAYAWMTLDTAAADLPAERLAELDEVSDDAVDLRWRQLKGTRFPDMEELDDPTRTLLRAELVVMGLVAAANSEWVAQEQAPVDGPVDDNDEVDPAAAGMTKQAFREHMASYGLMTADPEGLLGPDELTDLADIGSALLSAQLTNVEAGDTRYFQPFGDDTEAHVVFVEESVASVPLDYTGARELVLDRWRQESDQVGAAAIAFRAGLTEAARDLPEAQDLITPLIDMASSAAESRITEADAEPEAEPLDEAARQAIHDEELAGIQNAIDTRLAEFASQFWEERSAAVLDGGGQEIAMLTVSDVPKNYRTQPDEDEAADSVERFLKINSQIFQQDVDGVTGVLRHAVSGNSVVVRVTGRRFPPKVDMLADSEGMEQSRSQLSRMNLSMFRFGFSPDRLSAPHSADNPYGHDLMKTQVVSETDEDSAENPEGVEPK
jgi:hypothetical protein